jgi:hypothetical protein
MKRIIITAMAATLVAASMPQAYAAVCAVGVHRAGCVGFHGAVVVGRPLHHHSAVAVAPLHRHGVVVVAPIHHHCFFRAGVRICR